MSDQPSFGPGYVVAPEAPAPAAPLPGQPSFGPGYVAPTAPGTPDPHQFVSALTTPSPLPTDPNYVVVPSGDPRPSIHVVAVAAGTHVALEMTGTIIVYWQDGILKVFNANRLMGMMDTTTGNAMNIVGHLLRDGVQVV